MLYNIMPDKIKVDNFQQRILFATVCMQMSFGEVYDYLSAGNVDVDALNNLSAIDNKSVRIFLQKRAASSSANAPFFETPEDENILDTLFDNNTPLDELSVTLQKLPNFIKCFIAAVSVVSDAKPLDKGVEHLRDILKRSAITSVKSDDQSEVALQAVELRQKNFELAKKVNLLLEDIAQFAIAQDKQSRNGIISTRTAGYCICEIGGEKYQFRYVLEYAGESEVSVSIYLNARDKDAQKFHDLIGNNPLAYAKKPVWDARGWYFYDDIFTLKDDTANIAEFVAEKVKEAFNNFTKKIKAQA